VEAVGGGIERSHMKQGRTFWDVFPDTIRALNGSDGFGCFLALIALMIVAGVVISVAEAIWK
jgi:hypothetical protein